MNNKQSPLGLGRQKKDIINKHHPALANKNYMDNIYYTNIITNTNKLYASSDKISELELNMKNVYTSIPPDIIADMIAKLSESGDINIYHSNILNLPYDFNSSNFGFNANASINSKNIITVGGTITTTNLRSEGIIYESNYLGWRFWYTFS